MSDGDAGIQCAQLEWSAEGHPYSPQFQDVYYSSLGGLTETDYVFFQHNRLPQRFEQLAQRPPGKRRFVIGELGFGSGLNFLATWALWRKTAPEDAVLHYLSVEKHPFRASDLARNLALWPQLATEGNALLTQYPPPVGPGFHRLELAEGQVQLTLIFDDALQGLEQLRLSNHPTFCDRGLKVDAWYLDGFTPSRNPDSWSNPLMHVLGDLSQPGTTLATFTAAGAVRRGLNEAGFKTATATGFGVKRHMLYAHFVGRPGHDRRPAPLRHSSRPPPCWPIPATPGAPVEGERQALVIGAGLAGCHSARALAERGWRVRVLERHPQPASEASGNPQGLLYAKLSARDSPLARFNLLSLAHAQRHYRPFWHRSTEFGAACGLIQLAQSDSERKTQALIGQRYADSGLLQPLTPAQASERAGLELPHSGLYFPECGWLNPAAICRALLAHPLIELCTGVEATGLERTGDQWQLLDAQGRPVGKAPVVVIANAWAATQLAPTAQLPLKAIRGQITQLASTPQSRALKVALCGEGYLAPAFEQQHCLGASFNLRDPDTGLKDRDHRSNFEHLSGFGESVAACFAAQRQAPLSGVGGRVAFRCATPDYLPLVGPVPHREDFIEQYAPLRRDAKQDIAVPGPYWPGLYLNLGHGSRGLAYTPLSAQLLAAQINADPPPLDRELQQALNPARFIIRDLMRNRL